jgi:MATE family multidrug resistance protein
MGEGIPKNFASFRHIILMAAPLVLSQTSVMLMQVTDGLFVARHSREEIAAIGPAIMVFYSLAALFLGIAGYTNTFVAQYIGARRPRRVGAAIWQGIYLALIGGALMACSSLAARPIFGSFGHVPSVTELEIVYFRIMLWGSPLFLVASAVSGFFSGRGDNLVLTLAQFAGLLANVLLDWILVFGKLGFPEMGIAGAAWATVISQGLIVAILLSVYFQRRHREAFGTWDDRPFDRALFARLIKFGFPAGLRFLIEISVWTVFVVYVGTIGDKAEGEVAMAATNIAQRINGGAFFPIIGLGIAVSALVGQAQGANRPDLAAKATWRSLVIAEGWMFLCIAVLLIWPGQLMDAFHDAENVPAEQWAPIRAAGLVILKFVAIYCLVDAANIVLLSALQGAGDTRWTLVAGAVWNGLFLVGLLVLHALGASLYVSWAFVTLFVFCYACTWLVRFRLGAWKHMRVIEHVPADLEAAVAEPRAVAVTPDA